MKREFGVVLTDAETNCMVNAGFGNDEISAAFACLRGEQLRYFSDILLRTSWSRVSDQPMDQLRIDCFSRWATSQDAAKQFSAIVAADLSEEQARTTMTTLIGQAARRCA